MTTTADEQKKRDDLIVSALATKMVSLRGTGWNLSQLVNAVPFDAADVIRLHKDAAKVAAATP